MHTYVPTHPNLYLEQPSKNIPSPVYKRCFACFMSETNDSWQRTNELHPYKRMTQDVYTVMESATTMTMQADSVHKLYADWISAELNSREDLVIDFDCLQMCLDPQSELSLLMLPEEEKVCARVVTDDLNIVHFLYM